MEQWRNSMEATAFHRSFVWNTEGRALSRTASSRTDRTARSRSGVGGSLRIRDTASESVGPEP